MTASGTLTCVAPDRFVPCVVVPTYDNPLTIRQVVLEARAHVPDVIVVDDGSHEAGRDACARLEAEGLARVVRRERNGGKGRAVRDGLRAAWEAGFTHAAQVDGDGQHGIAQLREFLRVARDNPTALLLGYPDYRGAVPWVRRLARKITDFWTAIELGGRGIARDVMVGFRVYPLVAALEAPVRGERMDFDIEIAVRMAWAGVPIINLPVEIRYLAAEEGGVSHFQHLRDNLRFIWLHSRLCTIKSVRFFRRLLGFER